MEFFDSGQNLRITNINMEFLLQNKKNNLNNFYSYQLDGNINNGKTSYHMPSANFFFQNMPKTNSNNRSEVPFMISGMDNMKKNFVSFKNYINSKATNFMKESVDQWGKMTPKYSEFITPAKEYSCVSNSIASYLIGGFVGSKSQMNNDKHKLSFDLGEVIFNILQDYKCDKSFEKARLEKKFEMNRYGKKCKTLKDSIDIVSDKCIIHNTLIDNTKNIQNITSYQESTSTLHESKGTENSTEKILGSVDAEMNALQWTESSTSGVESDEQSYDSSDKEGTAISEKAFLGIPSDDSTCFISTSSIEDEVGCNHSNVVENKNNGGDMKSGSNSTNVYSEESSGTEKEVIDVPLLNSPSSNFKCISLASRMRRCSECSIDSTDSGSFIIFDDKCCDLTYNELSLEEIESDESDFYTKDEECNIIFYNEDLDCETDGRQDDDCVYDFSHLSYPDECDAAAEDKRVAEANARWTDLYKNIPGNAIDEISRKVKFREVVEVHKIIAWDYAYRAARLGPWMQIGNDRVRFAERIQRLSLTISPVLLESHRKIIYDKLYA